MSFTEAQLNHLAKLAETAAGQLMRPDERDRFDQFVQEGASAFGQPEESAGQRRSRLGDLAAKLHSVSKDLDWLRQQHSLIGALDRAGSEIAARAEGRRPSLHEHAHIMPKLSKLQSMVSELAEYCEHAKAAGFLPVPRKGGQPNDGRLVALVYWFSRAWELGARRPAGTSTDAEGERRGGPFVEFIGTGLSFLDPEAQRLALGQTVRDALATIKTCG